MIEDITFRNITVLHAFHKPVISIHNSDSAAVRHVLYENIVVEDAQMGLGDGTPYLIDFTTRVLSGKRPSVRIWSFDENSSIDHVTITGLNFLGEEIVSFDQLAYEACPANGNNIRILPSDE